MKKTTIILLALSLTLNVLMGGFLVYRFALPMAEASNYIKEPGTYGPPTMEIIDDDATIGTAGVTLQNTIITGNLVLTEDIDEGAITLSQVEVQGEVIIAGGGKFDLVLSDAVLAKITVQENDGSVTIISKGATTVDLVEAGAEVSLQEDRLSEAAPGFMNVLVHTDDKVILLGDFDGVDVEAERANVKIVKGSVAAIHGRSPGADAVLDLAGDVQVQSLVLETVMTVTGNGNIQSVEINAPGLVQLQGAMGEVSCRADGVFLELTAGSIEKLLVPQREVATSIALAEDTFVASMELNARTGVTGQGQIGTATINHSGVTLDQTPANIVIAQGLAAMIGGEEYRVETEQEPTPEPEPEPDPEPTPEPPKQKVTINGISNMTLLAGETGTKVINVSPASANLSVTSSNTGVATVSMSGKTVTVTAKGSGTATISVKGSRTGYTSATKTFKVTVNALTAVKEFKVEKGLSPGKSLVFVTLYDPNPSKYVGKVRIGGVVLDYLEEYKQFYGEVSTPDASAGNVRVD